MFPGHQSANEERLEMAMNAAQIGTFDWNIETGEVFWSASLEQAMGLPVGGFGKTMEDFFQICSSRRQGSRSRSSRASSEGGLRVHCGVSNGAS